MINQSIKEFTDGQLEISNYLKKNCYATQVYMVLYFQLFYELVERHPEFNELNDLDFSLNTKGEDLVEFGMKYWADDRALSRIKTNPQQYDLGNHSANQIGEEDPIESKTMNTLEEDILFKGGYLEEQVENHFSFLFVKNKMSKIDIDG